MSKDLFVPSLVTAADGSVGGRLLTRQQFLRTTAVVGVSTALSPWLSRPAGAAAGVTTQLSPFDLDFSIIQRYRPIDLLAPHLVQVRVRFDHPNAAADLGAGMQARGEVAQVEPAGAAIRVTSPAADATLFRTGARPVAPYATVILDVAGPARGSGGQAAVLAGLVRGPNNYIVASFDAGADASHGTVSVDVMVGGRRTRVGSAMADLSASKRYAFVVNENVVNALVGGTHGWVPVVTVWIGELPDLRRPEVLGRYRYGFGLAGSGAAVGLVGLRAGYYGQVGIRDPHVVSYPDGRPFIQANKLYFTATNAGLGFIPTAHWGVWTLDLDDLGRIEQVGVIFFARNGLVLGDHAGHIVVDEDAKSFRIAVTGWGDFEFEQVHVQYARTSQGVLRGVHVVDSHPMPLPSRFNTWDPAMARVAGRWYVAFVETRYRDFEQGFDFHPALARSPLGGRVTDLHRVGADWSRHQTEGCILQRIGGRWYLLASDGDNRQYRVYNLRMDFLGTLSAPYVHNAIPHPMVVPVPRNGRTEYLLLTFDGTPFHPEVFGEFGTHGRFILMRAKQTQPQRVVSS
jgi:hypothetical protein